MTAYEVPEAEGPGGNIPVLGLGTWQVTGEKCEQVVSDALELGYRHIDTAQAYGNEAEIGRAVSGAAIDRSSLFITTKLWMDSLDKDSLRPSVVQSLEKLQTDYVDLLLIHWPNKETSLEETLKAMNDVKNEGLTHHIGVSNFNIPLLRDAQQISETPIFCNQVEYHPYLSQEPVLQYCRENNMLVIGYSPLARGLVRDDLTLQKIAAKHHKTPAQIALRWITQQPGVGAVSRATSRQHLEKNLDIFDFRLDFKDMDLVLQLERGQRIINPSWAPEWDT